jgi:hypothetical protein
VNVAVHNGDDLVGAKMGGADAANSSPKESPVAASDLTSAPQAGSNLELTVRDDGFGIAAGRASGFGLRGMQERVQALGGEFAIETGSNRTGAGPAGHGGTCVRIVIPLPLRQSGSPPSGVYASTST